MKRFTEYLNEDFDPAIFNADGGVSINDPTVMDAINSNLEMATSCAYRTPYNALEEIRKMLAYYKIFLPKGVFLDQNHGNDVFEVSQFGEKMGMNNSGEVVSASDSPLFVYFEWTLNEKGMHDTFACLCTQDELDEILADYEAEAADDETELQEQHSVGKLSKMLYKVVNQTKAAKQSDDVDSLINHEKQGKTFTQVNEKVMPDLNKKLGSKKVTLANQMRKEDKQLNELHGKSKEAMKKIKARLEKKHDDEWEKTTEKRKEKKSVGPADTRGEDKKRNDLAKRWLRADKAEKKLTEAEELNELSKKKLASYIKKASHDVATKSAATGRYADRANKARDKMKKGDYSDWQQGKKDDEFADKMFKKSWNRRKGIAKAADKLATEESELMTTKKEKEMYVHTHKTSGKEKHMTTSKPTSDEWTVKKLKKR